MEYETKYKRLLERISNTLKQERKSSGFTQEELAEKVGFSTRYYQRIESGKQSVNLLTLYKVCKSLKIDVSDLFK